jgi:NAD kinase
MGLLIEQKIVIVRRPTRLQGLRRKFATVGQAKFLMEMAREKEVARRVNELGAGAPALAREEESPIEAYRREDDVYQQALKRLQSELHGLLPIQVLDRDMLPSFVFGPNDVVVTVGQDGLVANAAKYAVNLPIVAVNPDPQRIDGILLPFRVEQARNVVIRALDGRCKFRHVTLAQVELHDGQSMLAFNDFFVGSATHVSARYQIEFEQQRESHSSSGLLVSTGAGSTGWLSSVFNMAAGLGPLIGQHPVPVQPVRLPWEDRRLVFVVREPFVSKSSSASVVSGRIEPGQELIVESQMPSGGVIFSDGIESDYLDFNSGAIARIHAAEERAKLVIS